MEIGIFKGKGAFLRELMQFLRGGKKTYWEMGIFEGKMPVLRELRQVLRAEKMISWEIRDF